MVVPAAWVHWAFVSVCNVVDQEGVVQLADLKLLDLTFLASSLVVMMEVPFVD